MFVPGTAWAVWIVLPLELGQKLAKYPIASQSLSKPEVQPGQIASQMVIDGEK